MTASPVVIVTGASRGIGASAARWLADRGISLALMARSAASLQEVADGVERRGARALPLALDIADPAACRRAVSATISHFGRLDGLINNAGTLAPLAPAAQADPASWRRNIEVNLLGPFYMIRAGIEHLRRENGRIVNVSSGAARHPVETWSAYCTAKAGLTHLTRVVAVEEPRVTVVSLRPGVVDTRMQAKIREDGPGIMPPEKVAYFEALKRENRLEPPAVPARAIAWLVLQAPREWSGELIEYDDPRLAQAARDMFPEPHERR